MSPLSNLALYLTSLAALTHVVTADIGDTIPLDANDPTKPLVCQTDKAIAPSVESYHSLIDPLKDFDWLPVIQKWSDSNNFDPGNCYVIAEDTSPDWEPYSARISFCIEAEADVNKLPGSGGMPQGRQMADSLWHQQAGCPTVPGGNQGGTVKIIGDGWTDTTPTHLLIDKLNM